MKTTLIIARHGNTFRPGETPTRVGAKTDLPLVEEGRGLAIGKYLVQRGLIPDTIYAAPLLRTTQTAELAAREMGFKGAIIPLKAFTEIDYGPDENKTEEEVALRLGNGDPAKGKAILAAWDNDASVPDGWKADPQKIIAAWFDFADKTIAKGAITLVVTSNGIIRFAPYLTGDFGAFAQNHDIKVPTGGVCIFEKDEGSPLWTCVDWAIKPYKLYP